MTQIRTMRLVHVDLPATALAIAQALWLLALRTRQLLDFVRHRRLLALLNLACSRPTRTHAAMHKWSLYPRHYVLSRREPFRARFD